MALAHLYLWARPERSTVEQAMLALNFRLQLQPSADHISSESSSILRQTRLKALNKHIQFLMISQKNDMKDK